MAFVRQRRPSPHQIGLELEVVGEDVCATIHAPGHRGPPLLLERVPLRQAVLIAVKLAQWSAKDVAIVDRHGLWPSDFKSAPRGGWMD